jgi:predicted Rdx family selenoprotein
MVRLADGGEGVPMISWLRRRAAYRALIEADAKALIERFGDQAYSEARFRQHDAADVVDANRPLGHWERVKEAIRRIEGRR